VLDRFFMLAITLRVESRAIEEQDHDFKDRCCANSIREDFEGMILSDLNSKTTGQGPQ
jgi:hypothetical protein